jgi:copper resistance protein B
VKRAAILLLSVAPCFAVAQQEPQATGESLPVGDAPAPAIVRDSIADRAYDAAQMERARRILAGEHGGAAVSKVMGNLIEYTSASEGGGYRWDAEAWYGGDRHRFVFKTEGEGLRRAQLGDAEIQALYSRAIGRYTDVQAGARYVLQPDGRAYATVAVESLLPWWFKVQAALFVSDRGDVFSRLEGFRDLRLTQRLILQPRAEISIAAQDVPGIDIGSGMSSAELGLRLRYEVRREFAPYVGVNFERRVGRTADFSRAAGHDAADTSFVLGVRAWF